MAVTGGASKKQRTERRDALEVLPGSAWVLVLKKLDDYDHLGFGLTCRTFLEAVTKATANPDLKKVALKTDLTYDKLFEQMPRFSLSWFQWVLRSFKRKKGVSPKELGIGEYYDHLYDSDLMYLAAFQGSKKVMEWLASRGISFGIERYGVVAVATGGAAAGGHIEILEWLGSEGCRFDWSTCSSAARGGHLDVLKWLRSQDPPCPWNWRTCEYAAGGGHLAVLQWARSQDPPCPWGDEDTCWRAAQGGHLDVLKWARSQDPPCPWDWKTCWRAVRGGHLDVLKWARSQDPPCLGTTRLVLVQLKEVTLMS
ncbi:hypothetical protein A3770_18p81900 [Chloropicon primus]|uniref:Ankyrin repeat domain-containing protein n=1 Tax=Chloropicon primus TaxID=1764295 RepID=A0A5B8N0U7_9CHLO|nr:hypothetical protein A3770_18p81900 [Chloropicon primus]|eukprot:QDZ25672.1 hypothetical protein A3770_18p81900 [Chloropicon primus]